MCLGQDTFNFNIMILSAHRSIRGKPVFDIPDFENFRSKCLSTAPIFYETNYTITAQKRKENFSKIFLNPAA
jgi:hypothetical protein